ncbi:MAG: hypothetical protein WC525_10230 [Candidatus Thermoplasmatota archaeon]
MQSDDIQVQQQSELEEKIVERTIIDYFLTIVPRGGVCYMKSKHIAHDTNLTPHQIGTTMPHIENRIIRGIRIERWGRSGAITWMVMNLG